MSDRRFPEQHEDLQDRARWDEESPETDEHDETDTGADLDAAADTDTDSDLHAEQTDLSKPDAGETLPHPDVDARTDVGTDDLQPDAPLPAPASFADVPASSDSAGPVGPAAVAPGGRLFPEGSGEKLRDRWQHIQIDFVDDPRHAVEEADTLVEQVAGQLTAAITANRRALRDGWDKQGAGSAADDSGFPTEQLRTTLQQYRSMLNQLLDA